MKNLTKFQIYLFLISLPMLVCNGCKKEETPQKIEKQNPTIIWENPYDIFNGTLLTTKQLNAKTDVPGRFLYTPKLNTKLSAGTNQELKVEFEPLDTSKYNIVFKTVIINVKAKLDPFITWSNPVDIAYSTLLSGTQLNATADIPGSFDYTPSLGTKLYVGKSRELKAVFTPTDTVTYDIARKTVTINVHWGDIIFNPNLTYGSMTDQEGKVYKTITIGSQTWMAENLQTTKYRNGEQITNITNTAEWLLLTSGAYCWFNNDSTIYKSKMGALYNWYTVHDSRNLAPVGWHIPTKAEWNTLITYLGENESGNKMKEVGMTHWDSDSGATNESGFSGIPAGTRLHNGVFYNIGLGGYFWSSSEINSTINSPYATGISLTSFLTNCGLTDYEYKYYGFSVRCIKD